MTYRTVRATFIAFTCILISQINAMAANKASKDTGSSPYINIPVLYMTDRGKTTTGYNNQRKYEKDSIYNVYFGSLNYTVKNTQNKELTPELLKLGWSAVDKCSKNGPVTVQPLPGSGTAAAYNKFGQAILELVKKTGRKEIFVFVHGFNNPFAGAAGKAALLAYHTQCPVVLYSWPSAGKLLQYSVDACNNEWSQEHFNRLVEELVMLKDKYDLKFDLVAHSMGNRLAIRAAQLLRGQHLFEQAFLIDPDLDAETFVHYVARYALGDKTYKDGEPDILSALISDKEVLNHARLRILFSRRDNALPITEFFFGGYTRLGQGADNFVESLFCPDTMQNALQNASNFLQSNNLLKLGQTQSNQSQPSQSTQDELPPQSLLSEGPEAQGIEKNIEALRFRKAFEWIDYTILDHGLIGHTVPFDLVSNLWLNNQPGTDLAIISVEDDKVNRFTKIATRIFKEGQRIGAMGSCKKVVFAKNMTNASAQSTPGAVGQEAAKSPL